MNCYFVRGLSRSGGTLMATILDAHPEVSMSYETYEHLLVPTVEIDTGILKTENTKELIKLIYNKYFSQNKKTSNNFNKFISRAERAGIDRRSIQRLFREHLEQGQGFNTFEDRMRFVQRLTMEKMRREGKQYWGAKIVSTYDPIGKLYPNAKFLFMLRDGRDIAASRKMTGDFNQTVEQVAKSWCNQVEKFKDFASKFESQAKIVRYENLVTEPEKTLRDLVDFLELSWSERLINYHKLNLTIHNNPVGHLSRKQIKTPINTSSIGRWKYDLNNSEIESFESMAIQVLQEFMYK